MIDVALLVGRLLLVVLLYLFLFAVMKTGVGLVKGQRKKVETWRVNVVSGPREVQGSCVSIVGPLVVGKAIGSDLVIPENFVSGRHARFNLMGDALMIEDLGSTNGTYLNGMPVVQPTSLQPSDVITIGNTSIQIERS